MIAMTATDNDKINLFDFDRPSLEKFFLALGEKPFRASQVLKWVYHQGVLDFDQMSNLSKSLRQQLQQTAGFVLPKILLEQQASDGTCKYVLQLSCGNCIEMVWIPETQRATLCVSSQVGCALNCSFCSTAKQGFNRNLSVAEIIGQVWLIRHKMAKKLTNVVFMGMGEPLLNMEAVVSASNLMMADLGFGLSKYKVTISTSGLVPLLKQLSSQTQMSLAVSLHAPNDQLRNQLVPINKKYPIAELLRACREFVANDKRRKVTFEYVMLSGVNDQPHHAKTLAKLLRRLPAKVNLIPFNPFPNTDYQCSTIKQIEKFQAILMQAGIMTMTRKTRGEDIDAACGQLVGQVASKKTKKQRVLA